MRDSQRSTRRRLGRKFELRMRPPSGWGIRAFDLLISRRKHLRDLRSHGSLLRGFEKLLRVRKLVFWIPPTLVYAEER